MSRKGLTTRAFEVYSLAATRGSSKWVAAEEQLLGRVQVRTKAGEVLDRDVLSALACFSYRDNRGRLVMPFPGSDKRTVYAECTGSGLWECGLKKDHYPILGLKLAMSPLSQGCGLK